MGNLLRFLLLRFLPRRLVPIFLVWDVYQLFKGRRSNRYDEAQRARQAGNARRRNNNW